MKFLNIYILERSHRWWSPFISSSFFPKVPFDIKIESLLIIFEIYQLDDEIFKYVYWKKVIDDDLLLSPPLSFFPKISFPFQIIYLRSTLILEFINWEMMKFLNIYIYIYILERSHRWWSFISSSFFLSLTQDFLSFPSYLFTIDIKISINKCFGIYQLKGWSFIFSSFFFSKVPFDIKIEEKNLY